MGDLFGVRMVGPLAPFAVGFADESTRLGFTPLSVAEQLRLAAHVSRWLTGERLTVADLRAGVIEEFLGVRRAVGYRVRLSPSSLTRLLEYLSRVGAVAAAQAKPLSLCEQLRQRFRGYLLGERGMVVEAAAGYVDSVRPFVVDVVDGTGVVAALVTTEQIGAFVVAESQRLAPETLQRTASALRALLRFWHLDGVIAVSLIEAVPKVAYRWPGLPRAANPADIQALLDSCSPAPGVELRVGRRDCAIWLLLSRLGLRAGEVAGLQLEHLDWRAVQITLRGKGNRRDLLPLPVEVGAAIADYLRLDRPADALERSVFMVRRFAWTWLSPPSWRTTAVWSAMSSAAGSLP